MNIRLAKTSDLAGAAQLWFDRITLLQQSDPLTMPLPAAREKWAAAAASWVGAERTQFLVAEQDGALLGFNVVQVAAGRPGLHPARRGILLEMALDLHETHPGLSEQLLRRALRWLSALGVTQLEVDAPARYPVEAAFWRAQGGAVCSEKLRLRL